MGFHWTEKKINSNEEHYKWIKKKKGAVNKRN